MDHGNHTHEHHDHAASDSSAQHEPNAGDFGALELTDGAAQKVIEIREAENIEPHYQLRVKVQGGGCSGFQYDLYFDEKAEDDTEFTSKGVTMVCDQMSFMYLMGTRIDYVEGLQGAGFKFENPNSTGSCGCGSSFSV
jgi:iron-sulfur cluster insertion protein